ncbi:hypothetical protein D3C74_202560 [compost metagenome]
MKICCVLLGLFYLKNSLKKLSDPFLFAQALKAYKLVPDNYVINVVAPMLIVIEVILSLLLISNFSIISIMVVGLILQSIYTILLLININKNFTNICNCFPLQVPHKVTTKKLLYNICLLLIFVVFYGIENRIN